jgi:uncharacterized membrane protein
MVELPFLFVCIGILCIGLSMPLIKGKVKPNRWYGFRLQVTLKDDRIWYPANRFGGKLLLAYGLAVLGAAVLLPLLSVNYQLALSNEMYMKYMVVLLISGAVLILFLSWRYARLKEKEIAQHDK